MVLQNLKAITERESVAAAEAVVPERLRIVKETAAASLTSWNLEKIDMVCKCDEACATVERLKTDFVGDREQVSGKAALQSELGDAWDASSRFKARWTSVREHAKVTKHPIAQVALQLTVPQVKLAHEKSRPRAFEGALLNTRDAIADQNSLTANSRQFLGSSLQKSGGDFFKHVPDHVRVKESMFCANMSNHCDVVATTARQQHEDICPDIAEWLDRARSMPEFGAKDNSAIGCSRAL